LLRHLDDLNLDVDLDKLFGERVHVDKTWVNSTSEATKLGNETDVALGDGLVWIRADNTAWNGAESTDATTERVNLVMSDL
jgi:hypothetical protein